MESKEKNLTICEKLNFTSNQENFDFNICLSTRSLEEILPLSQIVLHKKEILYFETISRQKRQHSFLLGRYCAKKSIILTNKIESMSEIYIKNGIFEQPIVCHPIINNMNISITHSDNIAAAISFPETHPSGIDVEMISRDKIKTIKTQLSITEIRLSKNNIDLITIFWTAKEAMSKVFKCGLMIDFNILE
ncbi:4'-phosphopantetheinyl transferase superfamily protein, partial [Gammaproteobacteria bacterium]|nr:4'-phosphopantetheinyl transferase superfamily protein [Gammaproteobacteria bacterium]